MADFKKDSLSEFLRPVAPATKGDFRQAPSVSPGESAAPSGSSLDPEMAGYLRRRAPTAGPDELMAHLRAHGPVTPAALLEAVGLALGPGLETLDRLERFGLLARETRDGVVLLRAAS